MAAPNPPCTAPGISFFEDSASNPCFFCILFRGIGKKVLACRRQNDGEFYFFSSRTAFKRSFTSALHSNASMAATAFSSKSTVFPGFSLAPG